MTSASVSRQRTHTSTPRGFTLLELLTVTAILGVLVALLVPAAGNARREATLAKSLGRMRTLGTAYLSYAGDNNQTVPLNDAPADRTVAVGMWTMQTAIAPFLTLPETGDGRFASSVWWDGFAEIQGNRIQGSGVGDLHYPSPMAWPGGPPRNRMVGWSFNYLAHEPDSNGHGFSRLNQITQPSRTAMFLSRRQDNSSTGAWNSWSDGKKYSPTNPPSLKAKRLIFFFDGHFESQVITAANYNASGLFQY